MSSKLRCMFVEITNTYADKLSPQAEIVRTFLEDGTPISFNKSVNVNFLTKPDPDALLWFIYVDSSRASDWFTQLPSGGHRIAVVIHANIDDFKENENKDLVNPGKFGFWEQMFVTWEMGKTSKIDGISTSSTTALKRDGMDVLTSCAHLVERYKRSVTLKDAVDKIESFSATRADYSSIVERLTYPFKGTANGAISTVLIVTRGKDSTPKLTEKGIVKFSKLQAIEDVVTMSKLKEFSLPANTSAPSHIGIDVIDITLASDGDRLDREFKKEKTVGIAILPLATSRSIDSESKPEDFIKDAFRELLKTHGGVTDIRKSAPWFTVIIMPENALPDEFSWVYRGALVHFNGLCTILSHAEANDASIWSSMWLTAINRLSLTNFMKTYAAPSKEQFTKAIMSARTAFVASGAKVEDVADVLGSAVGSIE